MSQSALLVVLICMLSGCGGVLLLSDRSPTHLRILRRLNDLCSNPKIVDPSLLNAPHQNRYSVRSWWVQRRLLLAQFSLPSRWIISVAAAALIAAILAVSAISIAYGGAFLVAFACLTMLFINHRASRNRGQFLQRLPSFIERLHQLLGAGNSVPMAFDKALEYSDPLIQAYLRPVSIRLTHGGTFSESLNVQGLRLGLPELSLLSVIAHANARFGGSLGEVLSRVATVMIDRSRVQKEFDAMTAEMRASAKILVLLPIGVSIFVLATNPSYPKFFLEDPLGHILLAIALGMLAAGTVILRFMCRIDT